MVRYASAFTPYSSSTPQAAITFINAISEELFEVFEIQNNDVLRIRELMTKYRDLPNN
ncbi:hypothetical protein [Okeania sp.]|uniref:hypothetical protein n=1 Tax=Okeania sp. TaxID=3100323 RepID=UPI002B4B6C38|nr:hypothetical protein [Okeania sp.]MEB3341186.1 hypothetical protein [Okeania sp.]